MFSEALEKIVTKIEGKDVKFLGWKASCILEAKLESALLVQIDRGYDDLLNPITIYLTPRHSRSHEYPCHFRFIVSNSDYFYQHEMGIREAVSTFVLETLFG